MKICKNFGIPEGWEHKIAWNSKGVGHKRFDLLNRGCTIFSGKAQFKNRQNKEEKVFKDRNLKYCWIGWIDKRKWILHQKKIKDTFSRGQKINIFKGFADSKRHNWIRNYTKILTKCWRKWEHFKNIFRPKSQNVINIGKLQIILKFL